MTQLQKKIFDEYLFLNFTDLCVLNIVYACFFFLLKVFHDYGGGERYTKYRPKI